MACRSCLPRRSRAGACVGEQGRGSKGEGRVQRCGAPRGEITVGTVGGRVHVIARKVKRTGCHRGTGVQCFGGGRWRLHFKLATLRGRRTSQRSQQRRHLRTQPPRSALLLVCLAQWRATCPIACNRAQQAGTQHAPQGPHKSRNRTRRTPRPARYKPPPCTESARPVTGAPGCSASSCPSPSALRPSWRAS